MRNRLLPFAVVVVTSLAFLVPQPILRARQASDDKYTQALKTGDQALQRHQWDAAIAAYKQANGLHNKSSTEAMLGLSRAYQGLEAFRSAIDACTQGLKYAGDDTHLEALLRNGRGTALVFMALDDPREAAKDFRDAEADFRAVLDATDTIPLASYNLGIVLIRENREPEGKHELQAFIDRAPRLAEVAEARRIIENPRRAKETFAPDFSMTTMKKEYISPDDLRGKTVLLDFWGTWCGPCREATPSLVSFYKKYANNPSFVMIGVACGDKEDAWRAYVAENKMGWAQYFDNRKVQTLFHVSVFPNYVVIDREGIVRGSQSGWAGARTMDWIEGTVKTALKSTPKTPAALPDRPEF